MGGGQLENLIFYSLKLGHFDQEGGGESQNVLNFGATFFGVKNAILWLDDLKCFHLSTFSYLYSYKTGLKHQCSIKNDKYPSKMQI